jgi:molybdopterin adenylyltransferase
MAEPELAALLVISTSRAAGEAEDRALPELAALARGLGLEPGVEEIVTDEREAIAARLRELADSERFRLILTSGGTGFSPSDVTPEATADVIDRETPGVAEAIRLAARERTAHWLLSRGRAGIRGGTLIVNLPGSPRSIGESTGALGAALPHGLRLLAGEDDPHRLRG